MKLKAKAEILFGGKKIKEGEIFETDKKTASIFLKLKWVEKAEAKKK